MNPNGQSMCDEVREYQQSYDLLLSINVEQLQSLVERVKLEIRMTAAAITIQKNYRVYMWRKLTQFKMKCARKL